MRIPGYSIERLIGKGGMASVYLAVQKSLNRRVALKVMNKFDDPRQAERFLHEGRVIAALNHRNIITIYDVGTVGDRHFIAMEYLQGRSLTERIEEGMPLAKSLSLLEQMAACLHHVHRRGIIHRDIKPSNILFHADGTPKLTDFGIAKLIDADQELTLAGSALGSPYYLSPEQAEGMALDGRSDIYALGIVFYQMLTGERPYAKPTPVETIVAHLTQPLPVLPERFLAYQDLLEAMIAKAPDERVATAKELAYRVREAKRIAPPGERVGDASPRRTEASAAPKDVRSTPRRAKLIAGGLLVAVLLAFLLSVPPSDDAPPASPEAAAPQRPLDDLPTPTPADTRSEQSALADVPPADDGILPPNGAAPPVDAAPVAAVAESASPRPAVTERPPRQPVHTAPPAADLVTTAPVPAAMPSAEAQTSEPVSRDAGTPRLSDADDLAPRVEPPTVAIEPVTPDDAHSAGTAAAASLPGVDADAAGQPPQAVDVVDADGGDDRTAARIDALLQSAERALGRLRLTRPRDDNALHYYRQVLALDPQHAGAHDGLARIATTYLGMAERAVASDRDAQARSYVQRGLRVRGDHSGLLAMRERLATRQREQALAMQVDEVPVLPGVAAPTDDDATSVIGRKPSGNIVEDFRRVWRAVFD